MQTCHQCNAQSPDSSLTCVNCGADLTVYSATNFAKNEYISNPRVKLVRVLVARDACPACQSIEGSYEKEEIPDLPVEGCSHEYGCRCFYQPYLTTIYP